MRRSIPSFFKTIAVWGGGTMGGGIAQVIATANMPVTVVEVSQDRVEVSRKTIETSLGRVAKKKCNGDEAAMKTYVDKVMGNLSFTTDEAAAAGQAELIIEAVVENIEVKKELFAKLDKMAPKEAVFGSNTSSLRIGEMAAVTGRADRFAGMHFFSPVPMMKLLEIVRPDAVSDAVIQRIVEFSKAIGKVPVVATDTDGFITTRLLIPYLAEACRLVERGVATKEDVDTAMKLGCGYPMGPFEVCDSTGIDIIKFILDGWHKHFPEEPLFAPVKMMHDMVAAGKLGKKTGEGFYKYDKSGRRIQ